MDSVLAEKRKFPRIPAKCTVLFRFENHSTWLMGTLLDLSASGLGMVCQTAMLDRSLFDFQVSACESRMIPEITGQAKVIRCLPADNNQFVVSAQLVRVVPAKRK